MVRSVTRPRVYDEPRVSTAIRLPESLHSALRELADEREVSLNYLVIRALRGYLQQPGARHP